MAAAAAAAPSFLSPPNSLPTNKTPPPHLPLPSFILSLSSSSSSPLTPLQHRGGDSSHPSLPPDLLSVLCPSLALANMVFFKSGYNVQVIVGDNEPEEKLIGRFRREVLRAGIIQESKRRRFFESNQERRKRKSREAAKRNRRRRWLPKALDKQGAAKTKDHYEDRASKKKEFNEEDDNWDLFDIDLPYC